MFFVWCCQRHFNKNTIFEYENVNFVSNRDAHILFSKNKFFFSGATAVTKNKIFMDFSWFCYFIFKANQDAIAIFLHRIFQNSENSFFVNCLNFGSFDRKKTLKYHENPCTIFAGFWVLVAVRHSRMADPPFFSSKYQTLGCSKIGGRSP